MPKKYCHYDIVPKVYSEKSHLSLAGGWVSFLILQIIVITNIVSK